MTLSQTLCLAMKAHFTAADSSIGLMIVDPVSVTFPAVKNRLLIKCFKAVGMNVAGHPMVDKK